jgi:hypothetical protein
MPKPRHARRASKHTAPLPRERVAETGFIWWPEVGRVICPWPRHALWPDESAKLVKVIEQVDVFGSALRVPCWLFPDGRPPVPVNAADPNFLRRWSEGRASLVRG